MDEVPSRDLPRFPVLLSYQVGTSVQREVSGKECDEFHLKGLLTVWVRCRSTPVATSQGLVPPPLEGRGSGRGPEGPSPSLCPPGAERRLGGLKVFGVTVEVPLRSVGDRVTGNSGTLGYSGSGGI